MRRKTQRLRPYFDEGHKVQLRPEGRLTGSYLEGLRGTITRIKQLPDPKFFDPETPEDWEEFLEHFLKEQNEHRAKAYLQIMHYLKGERPDYPLSFFPYLVPKGHSVDIINVLATWTATLRKAVQEARERDQAHELAEIYASQAQVYDEVRERLMPKQLGFATLRGNSRSAIPAHS